MAARRANRKSTRIIPSKTPSVSTFFTPHELNLCTTQPDKSQSESMADSTPPTITQTSLDQLTQIQNTIATLPSKSDIADLKSFIKSELSSIRKDINELGSKIEFLEEGQEHLESMVSNNTQYLNCQDSMIQDLQLKVEDLDNRNRRSNLRIRGIPEDVTQEQLTTYLLQLFKHLEPSLDLTENSLERAHRALRPRPKPESPPRDVILKFVLYQHKESIWKQARSRGSTNFQGHSLQIFQDLCPTTIEKRRSLRFITAILQEYKIRYRWGFPFSLLILKDGKTLVYKNADDLETLSKSLNLDFSQPQHPTQGTQDKSVKAPRQQRDSSWSLVYRRRNKDLPNK